MDESNLFRFVYVFDGFDPKLVRRNKIFGISYAITMFILFFLLELGPEPINYIAMLIFFPALLVGIPLALKLRKQTKKKPITMSKALELVAEDGLLYIENDQLYVHYDVNNSTVHLYTEFRITDTKSKMKYVLTIPEQNTTPFLVFCKENKIHLYDDVSSML